MARGTVVGEKVVSQAQTKAFDEGYDRAGLGKSASSKERGRFIWSEKLGRLVRPWEVETDETAMAKDAPIMAGRFFENTVSPIDGHVFTSRADHARYMKEKGLTLTSDYDKPGGAWDRAEAKRAQGFASPEQKKARQEAIGRRLYEVQKMPQSRYDKIVREVERKRRERGPGSPTEE